MQMFSRKPPFDLAAFLAVPATAADIKRASDARRRHLIYEEKLEAARIKAGVIRQGG